MKATVLIPTHDHGPLLEYSLRSAMVQTETDLEILIVGDGAPPETEQLVGRVAGNDDRVRYFRFDKGPRHGEIHRHTVLQQASGEIVCYLGDDDLWFPDHVTQCLKILADSDLGSTIMTFVMPNNEVFHLPADMGYPAAVKWLKSHSNLVGLSTLCHRRSLYEKLENGWVTTPKGAPYTDQFMIKRLLQVPGVTSETSFVPTCLHFASPHRTDMPSEERLAEVWRWWQILEDSGLRARLRQDLYEAYCRQMANRTIDAAMSAMSHRRRPSTIDITTSAESDS